MLINFEENGEKSIFKNKKVLTVISIIVVVIIAGLLCIYPNIERQWLKNYLVGHPGISYTIIMLTAVFIAFLISKPSIDDYVEDRIKRNKSLVPWGKSKTTEKNSTSIQSKLDQEDFS